LPGWEAELHGQPSRRADLLLASASPLPSDRYMTILTSGYG